MSAETLTIGPFLGLPNDAAQYLLHLAVLTPQELAKLQLVS